MNEVFVVLAVLWVVWLLYRLLFPVTKLLLNRYTRSERYQREAEENQRLWEHLNEHDTPED
jgi:hypothetical protein